ncbi:hypothetical protein MRX96_002242 [Rhipicephalus microplus]
MAASIAPLDTAPYDCSSADDNAARPRTLRTVGRYVIYPVASLEECHYGHFSVTCGSSDESSASNGDPDANLLMRQKHHKPAFDFIFKALKYHTENDNLEELVIDFYRKGIEELQKRIAIHVSQGKGPRWARALRLIDKMKVNLDIGKARLDFLESKVK